MAIHPTAMIDKSAVVDPSCEIGPNVIIEQNTKIGKNNLIMANAFIGSGTTIGDNNEIHMGAVVGHITQDRVYKKGSQTFLKVGNNNVIREYATIHRGSLEGSTTVIGDNCLLMGGCHVAHDCKLGNGVTMANMSGIAGYVEIANRAILSGGVMVHQFVKIGSLAFLSGNSRVGMDVPPFMIVAERNEIRGVNLVGLKRAGFPPELIQEIRKVYRLFFRGKEARGKVLEKIKSSNEFQSAQVQEFIDFVVNSERGVCARYHR